MSGSIAKITVPRRQLRGYYYALVMRKDKVFIWLAAGACNVLLSINMQLFKVCYSAA